uniref:Uncharacterized protein n=1 Tax=Sphaerodactylus townsendi TaxID=933632 RepID=A0ACB8G3Q2_9SAUR
MYNGDIVEQEEKLLLWIESEFSKYGYIEEKIVVPRHTPYHLCAANTTGIYVLQSNISERYDTYCFNSSETRDKVCDPVTELYSSWPDNQSIIEIFNSDGTRYIGGRPYTDPPPVTDDDSSMGSGSANDRGTTDPNVLRPDVFQTSFDEDATHFSYGVHPKDDGILQSPDDPEDHDSKPGYEGPRPKNTTPTCTVLRSWGLLCPISCRNGSPGSYAQSPFPLSFEPTLAWYQTASSLPCPLAQGRNCGLVPGPIFCLCVCPVQFCRPGLRWPRLSPRLCKKAGSVVASAICPQGPLVGPSCLVCLSCLKGPVGDIRYSANDTRDDTLPGIVPPGDGEHYSTALSSSNSFFKQQVSTPYQPDGAHSGLEAEVAFPTNLTSDDLHLELGSSEEKDNSLEEEAFHAAAVFINGSAKDEESHHDQLLPVGKPGGRRGKSSSTNTTGHGVVQILIPPSESDNENEAAETVVVSTDGTSHEDSDHDHLVWDNENTIPAVIFLNESKNEKDLETDHTAVLSRDNTSSEDSTRDIILHREHSGWDSEDKYPTNASRDHLMPESIPSVKREHENESTHTVAISNDGTMHEVSIQDSLNHEADPGRDSGERHQANDSTNNVLPGNIFPNEHIHEKETFDTVVDSTDERNHDDVTDHPAWHVVQHEWDGYPTNSTKDEEGFAISPPPENNNEEKVFHTAVIHNNDAHNEDATQEPLLPVHQPGWDMEEEYSTNTSRDDILMGVIANSGSKHDPFPTDVVSHDVTKDEDSTPEPVKHVSEDKYSTNSTEGVLPPRIVPRRGSNHINNTYHTGFDSRGSQQEDSTPKSQPRAAHIPDWLIVVASLIALALILGVCIAVNSRRR